MLRTCLVLAQIGLLGATIHGQTPAPALSQAEKTGRSIFQTRCAMCHVGQEPASEMATEGPRRPATMGPLLSKANTANEAAILQKIKNGSRLMPGYKHTLSDEQINQVVAYIKTVDQPMTRIFVARPGE